MTELGLGVVLIICMTLLGNSFAQKLVNRKNTLQVILESIEKMKIHISFSTMEIDQVISESFKGVKGFEYFSFIPAEDFCLYDWWESCVNSLGSELGLSKEDKALLCKFSDGIGISDVSGQMSHLKLYEELFAERLKAAKETVNNKTRLYRILGFSLGCAVTLMVV